MKEVALAIKNGKEEELYTCTKSGKKISKVEPKCPTPSTYCQYRTACIIFQFYKENLKIEKNKK